MDGSPGLRSNVYLFTIPKAREDHARRNSGRGKVSGRSDGLSFGNGLYMGFLYGILSQQEALT